MHTYMHTQKFIFHFWRIPKLFIIIKSIYSITGIAISHLLLCFPMTVSAISWSPFSTPYLFSPSHNLPHWLLSSHSLFPTSTQSLYVSKLKSRKKWFPRPAQSLQSGRLPHQVTVHSPWVTQLLVSWPVQSTGLWIKPSSFQLNLSSITHIFVSHCLKTQPWHVIFTQGYPQDMV